MASIHHHKFPSKYWAGKQSNLTARSHYIQSKDYPTAAEIKDNLGATMAEVFFTSLTPEIKKNIGLKPLLQGPQGPLWNSPSNKLLGENKLVILPSLEQYLALSHKYIQDYGEQIEFLKEQRMNDLIAERLDEQAYYFYAYMVYAVEEIRERIKCEFYELYTMRLKEVFDKLNQEFKDHLDEKESLIRREIEEEKIQAIKLLKQSLECETNNVIKIMEESFELKLSYEKQWDFAWFYEYHMNKLRDKKMKWSKLFVRAQKGAELEKKTALKNLKLRFTDHILKAVQTERENFANIFRSVTKFYKNKIKELKDEINTLKQFINKNVGEETRMEQEAWECTLKDVVDQFQKFINFSLKEIPGQDKFLLSLSELVKNRVECLRKVKVTKDHTLAPDVSKPRNWGEVLVEHTDPEPPIQCEWSEPAKLGKSVDLIERVNVEVEGEHDEQSRQNKDIASILIDWVCNRLIGADLPKPIIPHEDKLALEVELVEYLESLFTDSFTDKTQEKLKYISRESSSDILTDQPQASTILPVGTASHEDGSKVCEKFVDDRVKSAIDILVLHPNLKNVIIHP